MNTGNPESKRSGTGQPERFHRWRARKDLVARRVIAVGGIGVIGAVGLIFVYLLWVVFPLFAPASSDIRVSFSPPEWQQSPPVWLSLEEQREIGFRISADGMAQFFRARNFEVLSGTALPSGGTELTGAAAEAGDSGLVAFASSTGDIHVVRHRYAMDYSGGVEARTVQPVLEFPYGELPLLSVGAGITDLAVADDERELTIAAIDDAGMLHVLRAVKQQNFVTGESKLETTTVARAPGLAATTIALSGDRRWLYVGDTAGLVHRFGLDSLEQLDAIEVGEGAVTELSMLVGGISVLAGDSQGRIVQAFPVRGEDNGVALRAVRSFEARAGAIELIVPEPRRKGFLALDETGAMAFHHSTAGKRVLELAPVDRPVAVALAPRANGALVERADGQLAVLDTDNPHPDVSWSSLWGKVWYENYPTPDYVWQSSAANTDFEPKFSLTPLVFGTLKAALYAMLFAVPLALAAAAYSAYFMAPEVREVVKPAIETMAALPTVVLGFLAGLWFAPFVEKHLAGVIAIFLLVPLGVLLFAWSWHRYNGRLKRLVADGWEPLLLVPVIVVLALLAMWLAGPVQSLFFGGDLRNWLTQVAGVDYDQRNALVVGCAMGFAVIPTIFSIAEDAFYGVPRPLSTGSLALGATPWQTMVHVVLPTASPGIFSALMIGLGRAVGETMIVLMASGNTPLMEWNIFEGMRTLAANIAIEMPESAVGSSHYRVLFLAALVLFVFTFIVNTGAEVVRQRLREKYSSL